MTTKSLNITALAALWSLCTAHSFAGDLYSLSGTDAQDHPPYGEYFREDGSKVVDPNRSWGNQTFRWGNVKGHAGMKLSSIYDDNIILNSTSRQKDLIWTITPTLGLGLGDYLEPNTGRSISLEYEPSYVAFTDKTHFNSFDNDVRLAARYVWSKLSVGLSQGYTDEEGSLVEIGDRVRSRVFSTFLGVNYDWTEKTSFTLNGRQLLSDYDDFNRVNDWVGELLANWRATEKVRLSLGGAYGVRDVTPGPNEDYEQAFLRFGYQSSEKLGFEGTIGVEFRQFQGGQSDDPGLIFGLGSTWQPREDWALTIEGHRRDLASISSGGVNINVTGISGIVRKQIRSRYFLSIAGSFDDAIYRGIATGYTSDRRDKYWSVSPSFDFNFSERWTFSAFYLYRDNVSEGGGDSFNNNQVGVRTAYRF